MKTVRNITFLFFVIAYFAAGGVRADVLALEGCECEMIEDNLPDGAFLDCGSSSACDENKWPCHAEYCGMCGGSEPECGAGNLLLTCGPDCNR